jgi:hypothetical protein
MKLNEALLIGGALLATLVLFKGGAASSNVKAFSGKSAVPVLPIEDKTPIFQTPQIETFLQKIKLPDLQIFKQFFPVTDTNIQLKQVLNIEEEKKDQRVSYLQDELDQTRAYIRTEQNMARVDQYGERLPYNKYFQNKGYMYKSDKQRIADQYGEITDDTIIEYYEDLVESETSLGYGGLVTGGKKRKYPLVTAALRNLYNEKIALRNLKKAEPYADLQQEQINLVQEEYQTRFGSLSRYG